MSTNDKMTSIIGWDLGGANLKLALLEGGRIAQVVQVPCPVRQDRDKFDAALKEALSLCPASVRHAVTMTGELSDVFTERAEGVAYLVSMMREVMGGEAVFYSGRAGFLATEDAIARPLDVASANWHASATLVADHYANGIFIDIGTTTTDLIPLRAGLPATRGYTDAERLAARELIYAGVVRTPVMAFSRRAPFAGDVQGIAAERFATMADVYRLTGDLPDEADPYPTPDLRGKSRKESAARLARMLGRDGSEAPLEAWVQLASFFAGLQLSEVVEAARALAKRETLAPDAPVIGAGCGRFLARQLASELHRPYRDFAEMIPCAAGARAMAASCAPAVAVALLAAKAHV
ncbi:MAG TPA: hydantoinase/oxoprolinase family protein [Methyloceanibacter sp.]|nr:hydantoinase/oxoprolinase family protein [Methyloceanibacter sp.]